MKIRVLWPGRIRKDYYRQAAADYVERIRQMSPLEIVEIREEPARDKARARRVQKRKRVAGTKTEVSRGSGP